jgi:hypothetical protein
MKDPEFIKNIVIKRKAAGEKVKAEFNGLFLQQLNWKPGPDSWGIGQCLDHLLLGNCLYFPTSKKIAEGKFEMTAWERWGLFSILFGRMLVHQLQEKVKKKIKAPKIFMPSAVNIDAGIIERFHKHLDKLLLYVAAFRDVNIDKVHITSPYQSL